MLVPIFLVLLCSGINSGTSCGVTKERMTKFLEAAIHLVSKVPSDNVSCIEDCDFSRGKPQDCTDLYKKGHNESGLYQIWPVNRISTTKGIQVYCNMQDGGWTVIQRRGDFGRERDYFYQDWASYKKGFGDLNKDFWLGNDNIYALTNQKRYSVYFELEDNRNHTAYAHYNDFWIDNEYNKYTLHISGYTGTAGDSMKEHNTKKFSTKDQNNDFGKCHNSGSCADILRSGWWFQDCHEADLNGIYNKENNGWGIDWHTWKNKHRNRASDYIRFTEIRIKPSESLY